MAARHTSKGAKRTCARKRAFVEYWDAVSAAQQMEARDGRRMRVYRCEVGERGEPRHWHIIRGTVGA